MSKLFELIAKGPSLVGAKNPERWEAVFCFAFSDELADKKSVFAKKDGESIEERLELIKGILMASGVDPDKAAYWIDLVTLASHSYALVKGDPAGDIAMQMALAKDLTVQESLYPDISAIMTVQKASTLSQWS